MRYEPLYAERMIGQCEECGYWRGEHEGCSENDDEMLCPSRSTFKRPKYVA